MFSQEFLNGDIAVNKLFNLQNDMWARNNIALFGLSPVTNPNPFIVEESLADDQDQYWNNGTNKLKEHLTTSKIVKDRDKMITDTWILDFNAVSNLISLSSLFIYDATKEGVKCTNKDIVELVEEINKLDKETRDGVISFQQYNECEFKCTKARLAFLPLVIEYGYKLKNSEYALRTQAERNKFIIHKYNGSVKYKKWEYDGKSLKDPDGVKHELDDKKAIAKFFKVINPVQYPFLNAIVRGEVSKDNIIQALEDMPEYDRYSALYFNFHWFDEVENTVLHTARKTINAKDGKVINYASLINSPRRFSNRDMADLCSNLIIIKNKIKALEVNRSMLFAPQVAHTSPFSWHDVDLLCDAFKVTTNGIAGRARVLLDDVYVDDGLLKIKWGGKEYNQYDIILGNIPDEIKERSSLSAISRFSYNYLNDPKRIMFCAKLRSQAVQVTGQVDNLTHEVPTRVVFADWEGYSFGDSFIISESYAKKLERNITKHFKLDRESLSEFSIGQNLEIEDLVRIDKKNRFSSYRDIYVENITDDELIVTARAPFGVGDKITNLHGSKGVVSIILPDDKMPYLKNDLSENMPAGPVDVIVPGISVYRRKSTGQLFEAISRALDIPELTLDKLKEQYGDVIAEYDSKSIFEFEGQEFKAPCGINHFIRLDHDACSKQSFAYIKSNYNYNLHTAEMELLNLAARGEYAILNELDVRSLNKHFNSLHKIRVMQDKGVVQETQAEIQQLYDYMRYLGWELKTDRPLTKEDIDDRWADLQELVNNNEIDLFSDTE